MLVDITENEGWITFPTIDGDTRNGMAIILKKWIMTDYGIRISLRTNFDKLIRHVRYRMVLRRQSFNGMQVVYATYDEEEKEITISLETNDVEKCNKLDKQIGRRVGCLKGVSFVL